MRKKQEVLEPLCDVYFGKHSVGLSSKVIKGKQTEPKPDDSQEMSSDYACWYDNEPNYPQKIKNYVQTVPQLASTIYWKANVLISSGIVYGEIEEQDGVEVFNIKKDDKIEEWLKNFNHKRYLREEAKEFYTYWNPFSELVLSSDRKMISGLKCHESEWCRWGKKNSKNIIDTCFIDSRFGDDTNNVNLDIGKYTSKLPVLYPFDWNSSIENIKDSKYNNFIYPVSGISSGYSYYQNQEPLHALMESGWLDVVKAIPLFKKSMMENQMYPKFMMRMPSWYMAEKYKGDWDKFSDKEKRQKRNEEFDNMEKFLVSHTNAGKSIGVLDLFDPITNKKLEGWQIELIDQKLLDSAYNEDSEIGSSYIANALGVHGSLVGTVPGSGGLGSKGSEIRNLMNIYLLKTKPEQDILLEPLQFAYEYNVKYAGFPPNYTFWFKQYWLTTLDNVTPSQRNFTDTEVN